MKKNSSNFSVEMNSQVISTEIVYQVISVYGMHLKQAYLTLEPSFPSFQ